MIDSVTRDGVQWTYTYANAKRVLTVAPNTTVLRYDSVTVTGPNGYNVKYTMRNDLATNINRNVIKSRTDELDRVTDYSFDVFSGKLLGITLPEGNSVSIEYDEWGNISKKTTSPKSGAETLVETQTVAVGCEANFPTQRFYNVLCYRPIVHVDALQRQTEYAYNGLGQPVKQLDPPVSGGTRRLTETTYTPSPGQGISRKTLVRVCAHPGPIGSATCSGTAASRTEYTYLDETNLPLTVKQVDEATGQIRTVTHS